MTLTADEFIRRFLLHTLPGGFHRIRHDGFLANGHRAAKLTRCRQLLRVPPAAATPAPPTDYRERYRQLTGFSLEICPDSLPSLSLEKTWIGPLKALVGQNGADHPIIVANRAVIGIVLFRNGFHAEGEVR